MTRDGLGDSFFAYYPNIIRVSGMATQATQDFTKMANSARESLWVSYSAKAGKNANLQAASGTGKMVLSGSVAAFAAAWMML